MSVEPKTKADSQKMDDALAKLAEEDPTFKTYTDEETGQTIIAGVGELQLDIIEIFALELECFQSLKLVPDFAGKRSGQLFLLQGERIESILSIAGD